MTDQTPRHCKLVESDSEAAQTPSPADSEPAAPGPPRRNLSRGLPATVRLPPPARAGIAAGSSGVAPIDARAIMMALASGGGHWLATSTGRRRGVDCDHHQVPSES
jgi:hypothetical protein